MVIGAIKENDVQAIKKLLKEGNKLHTNDLKEIIGNPSSGYDNNYNLNKIVILLEKYNALPSETLLPLKFIIFLKSKGFYFRKIKFDKILKNPEFLTQCLEFYSSPLELAIQSKMIDYVEQLIFAGSAERPIHRIHFSTKNSYQYLELYNLDEYKKSVSDSLQQEKKEHGFLMFKVIQLLLENSNENLDKNILKKISKKNWLLPYFSWAAKTNDEKLFNIPSFCMLFKLFPEAAIISLDIAILFDAKEFVLAALPYIEEKAINSALCVTIAAQNQELFFKIAALLKSKNYNINGILNTSVDNIKNLLHEAMNSPNVKVIKYLLEKGLNPNTESVPNVRSIDGALESIKILKILAQYKADLHYKGRQGRTLLHKACERNLWDSAIFLSLNCHLNLHECDKTGLTPLELIKNEEERKKFISLWEIKKNTMMLKEIRDKHLFFKLPNELLVKVAANTKDKIHTQTEAEKISYNFLQSI